MKFLPFIFLFFAIAFFATNNVLAISDSADINLQITGECNNNGICQSELENWENCPNDCPLTGTYDPGPFGVYIKNLDVNEITFDSAVISWQTTKPTTCVLFWGLTSAYEKEVISETTLSTEHSTKLNNLQIATVYHFKIICTDNLNLKAKTEDKDFSTLSALKNVSNFKATPGDKKIILSWLNLIDDDFKGVRLVRNVYFYPANFEDGVIIYDGTKEIFIDENLVNNKIYYYTIFAFDKNENYSSGAVAFATPQAQGEVIPTPITPEEPQPPVIPPKLLEKITINDFNFYSEGEKLILKNEKTIEVENDKNVIVTIDYKKIPKEFSTIIFNFKLEDGTYSYLLGPDQAKTIYFTTFQSPKNVGIYPIEIIFFDVLNNQVQKLDAELSVFKKEIKKPYFLATYISFKIISIFLWLFLILLIIILFLLIKRRKRKEKKEEKQNVISPRN